MPTLRFDLPTRRATTRLAAAVAKAIAPGDLIVLEGGLGAGKTFLSRALLRALGVPSEIGVPSPTFTLMNEYGPETGARVPVIHADLYRLLSGSSSDERPGTIDDRELSELGLRARRATGWAVVAEWATGAFSPLGGDGVVVALEIDRADPGASRSARAARIMGAGPRGEALAAAIAQGLAAPSVRAPFAR
jgi:tRNA threonylcarbamoyladenosine biosynthesis protein TsaE